MTNTSLRIEFQPPPGSQSQGDAASGVGGALGKDDLREVSLSISEAAEAIRESVQAGKLALGGSVTPPPVEKPPALKQQPQQRSTTQSVRDRFQQVVADSRIGRAARAGAQRVNNFFAPPGTTAAARAAAGRGAGAGGQAAGTGTRLSPGVSRLAITAGAAAVSVGALAVGAKAASNKFKSIADELQDVSGPIAAVRAQTEAALERSRVQRAQLLGERVARVEQARGELSLALDSLSASFQDTFADLAPLVEGVLDAVRAGVIGVQAVKEAIDVLITFGDPKEREELAEVNKRLADAIADITRENKGGEFDDEIRDFLGFNDPAIAPMFPGGRPRRRARPAKTVRP